VGALLFRGQAHVHANLGNRRLRAVHALNENGHGDISNANAVDRDVPFVMGVLDIGEHEFVYRHDENVSISRACKHQASA
jgi:hypothetical protein